MIPFAFDYATPSAFESDRERASLGLAADARRAVRLHARVARGGVVPLRLALQALGELVWSSDLWLSSGEYLSFVLDPVVTVFPDRVVFEAFSQDESACGVVSVDRSLLDAEGAVREGTTNVDFTAWLWAALAEMRSSRETWLRVGHEGLEVRTIGHGGRFERRVDLPESWVRAFLQLQAAMALPGTRLTVRPVDLLAAIRFLSFTKAKVSPRALRYEMAPGQDARLVLEPWEHVVPLRGAEHSYAEPRVIRTWGRRRLRLVERLLPYAESVEVFLKGRAMPSFYAVRLPGVTFVLGLSGFSVARFSATSFGASLADERDEALLAPAIAELRAATGLSLPALAQRLGVPLDRAGRLVSRLARRGQVLFDVASRAYRFRELLSTAVDEARLFPPDERDEEARRLLAAGEVVVEASEPRETRRVKRLKTPMGPIHREVVHRDWRLAGRAGQDVAEVVLDDAGRVIFGTCLCRHFRENLLNLGPCAHMRALVAAALPTLQDGPSSAPAEGEAAAPAPPPGEEASEPTEKPEEGEEEA